MLDRALDMDLANLNNSIRQIQHRQNEVTAKLSQKRKDLERHNPEELKEQAFELELVGVFFVNDMTCKVHVSLVTDFQPISVV